MLNVDRAKFRLGEQVPFEPADACALPFTDDAFDAVVCQLGVMFLPDKSQSYREVRRVLASRGRSFFNVWDSHRFNPLGRLSHEVLQRLIPSDPPQFYRIPFSYHQIDPIKEALVDAEFTDIISTTVRLATEVANVATLA